MVSAELIHNPYLLETTARFNGRKPKVNSAIERFEGRPLVEWADNVPQTFQDEMNGLDFDLSFTGTEADYQRINKAFTDQGISVLDVSSSHSQESSTTNMSAYDVRLTHKDSLEDVNTKRREIEDLLAWLNSHRNRWFEYDEFIAANSEALDGTVPYIIVNENPIQLELQSVSVETVDSARYDLASTELVDTPVLFMVNPKNRTQFRDELRYVLNRRDIDQGQLFFLIHPSMNQDRAIRIIADLGVESPQVVERPDDPAVVQYLDDFPRLRHVRRSVQVFRSVTKEVESILEKVDTKSAVTNANRIKQIEKLDSEVEKLRDTQRRIGEINPFEGQDAVADLYQQFEDHVVKWRNRKTGVTGQEQIWKAAGDYDFDLRGWVSETEMGLLAIMQSEQQRIEDVITDTFCAATNLSSVPSVEPPAFSYMIGIPNVIDALISQTGMEKVVPKNDFFGLFGPAPSSDSGTEYVEAASYDVWRTTVRGMLMPVVRKVVETCRQQLASYHAALIEAYERRLDTLIEKLLNAKDSLTATLSDEERMLEEDKDWLSQFKDRLNAIERN